MQIRAAKTKDIDTIVKIHFTAWQTVYRGHIPDNYLDALRLDDFTKRWEFYMEDKTNQILVLENEKNILGFVSFGPSDDEKYQKLNTIEILYIYFDSNVRNKGYGKKLYGEAEKIIKTNGYQSICIKVLASNMQACHFYEKLGFCLDKVYENDSKLKGISLLEKRYFKKL